MKTTAERNDIVSRARFYIEHAPAPMSTSDLIRKLDPLREDARRFATILGDAATRELRTYVKLGEPRPGKGFNTGKMVRPWIWAKPGLTADDLLTPEPRRLTLEELETRVADLQRRVAMLEGKP